jgi:hypothetical protein
MGSLFSSPKPPAPLDVAKTATQAHDANIKTADAGASYNRVNQTDAMGNSLNYTRTGTNPDGTPMYSAQQQLGATGQQYAQGLSGLGQQYMQRAGQGVENSSDALNRAYGMATSFSAPRMERERAQMQTQLTNQGLDPSSEAYRNRMMDVSEQQSNAQNTLAASLQGQMFNQGLAGRQQSMNELNPGMQFANQALQGNYANPTPVNVGNVDVAGLAQASKADEYKNYQAQVQQKNAMLGGLAGIGGSLLMAPMTGGGSLGGMIGSKILGGFSGGAAPQPAIQNWATTYQPAPQQTYQPTYQTGYF